MAKARWWLIGGLILGVLAILGVVFYQRQKHSTPVPAISFSPTPTPTAEVSPASPTPTPATPTPSPISSPSPTPVPTSAPTPTATSSPKPKPTSTPTPTPVAVPETYTVKVGDTLSSIARMFGLNLSTIEQLNSQITNPDLIYPGQVIRLKSTAPVPTPTPSPVAQASTVYRIATTKPVVFLTIDDGIYKEPQVADLMKSNGLVASFFLTYTYVKDNPAYFSNLRDTTGSVIEAHTYSHQNLVTLPYKAQKAAMSTGLDALTQTFGKRPTLIRPPFGNFNDDTKRAAGSLGIKTLVLWDVTVDGGKIEYASSDHLRPGDIVLIHFRPTLPQDIQTFVQAMKAQGLHTELLENWL